MKQKFVAILVAFVMTISLAACGEGEETTLTGMVVSVDGTVVSLMEMSGNTGGKDFAEGERPEMPECMEGFQGFGDFNPEDFEGTFPEGGNFPQRGDGERPEMPEGMELPEGMTMPENGEMPDFGSMDGMRPGSGNSGEDMETKDVDIADAHISVEIEGGKASGSMDDIKAGAFVTITLNGKGEVTNVLVSSQSSFGGNRGSTN